MILFASTHRAILAAEQSKSAVLEAENQRLRDEVAALRDREDRLMHQYVALAQPKPVTPLPPREPDVIGAAIQRKANGDPALRKHLASWAKSEQANETDVQKILSRIERWSGEDENAEPALPW